MGGRLALVVGSECQALRRLGFADRLASDLAERLSALGRWESAVSSGGALLNPTITELVSSVKAAFAAASERQAALLISFIGHGVVTGDGNFFLLAHDSPALPESDTALHLVQVLSEQMDRHPVDGLIVMIDACETQEGLTGGSQRLTDRTALAAKRIELLVATGHEKAYDGCFTRTTLSVFEHGLPARGENLLPVDLLDPLTSGCPRQVPGHWGVAHGGDPGLWLVPNVARRDDAVRGRSTAGLVDQLTEGVVLTDSLRERIFEVVGDTGSRLRVVIGPAGCGKSTLISLLIRPGLLGKAWFSPDYVAAAAFVSATTSLESLAVELSEQLRRRVDGFAHATSIASTRAADDSEVDVFESMVLEPLARIPTRWQPINIVIDGLDQAESGPRDLILAALAKLVGGDEVEHVKLLVGIREGDGLEASKEARPSRRSHTGQMGNFGERQWGNSVSAVKVLAEIEGARASARAAAWRAAGRHAADHEIDADHLLVIDLDARLRAAAEVVARLVSVQSGAVRVSCRLRRARRPKPR